MLYWQVTPRFVASIPKLWLLP